jgi:hypothetical protein
MTRSSDPSWPFTGVAEADMVILEAMGQPGQMDRDLELDQQAGQRRAAATNPQEWQQLPAPVKTYGDEDRWAWWEEQGWLFQKDTLIEKNRGEAAWVMAKLPVDWTVCHHEGETYFCDSRGIRRAGVSDNGQWWDPHVNIHRVGAHTYAWPWFYGDDPEPIPWEVLTWDEVLDIFVEAMAKVSKWEHPRYHDTYKDSGPRAARLLEQIPFEPLELLEGIEVRVELARKDKHAKWRYERAEGDLTLVWAEP